MSASLESHRDRFEPHEWQRLMKVSALYAQSFGARVFGGRDVFGKTGEEILGITLKRIKQGHEGYIFKDGDILFINYLCRCCRQTILALRCEESSDAAASLQSVDAEEDPPPVLTEQAAVAFLQRRSRLEPFITFVKLQKLKGKLRAYSTGFAKYGAENWDVEQIARDLRITPPTVAKYRSRLRELVEEFEIQRARRNSI